MLALATTLPPAHQAAAQQQTTQQSGLEEITVTGSRIHQNQDYASPNPISTFDAQKMESLGTLVNIPRTSSPKCRRNVSQFQAATTGGSAFFIGSTLANLRGLNPFFGTRTLTLVNSRRFIPTTQGDSVDLNPSPSILINRTEVVTGGASAALRLRRDFGRRQHPSRFDDGGCEARRRLRHDDGGRRQQLSHRHRRAAPSSEASADTS